ncbi:hypothetical protein IWZ03DRAFT_371517 [Phyllosticta citriasiana]|uniref:Secreted protein n=1 Tax=Phyllosticta citriasiana TaxID=595635 RepID=A0ABR1KYI6_9PEZI
MQCCSAGTITHICLARLAWVVGSCCALPCLWREAYSTLPFPPCPPLRPRQDDLPTSSNSALDDGNARQSGPPRKLHDARTTTRYRSTRARSGRSPTGDIRGDT